MGVKVKITLHKVFEVDTDNLLYPEGARTLVEGGKPVDEMTPDEICADIKEVLAQDPECVINTDEIETEDFTVEIPNA